MSLTKRGPTAGDPFGPNALLDFGEYQHYAAATAVYPKEGEPGGGLSYVALGLAGEAGEIANKVKKIYRDDDGDVRPETVEELAGELGDVLWYLAMLADELGLNLRGIAKANVLKLRDRQARGTLGGSGDDR